METTSDAKYVYVLMLIGTSLCNKCVRGLNSDQYFVQVGRILRPIIFSAQQEVAVEREELNSGVGLDASLAICSSGTQN